LERKEGARVLQAPTTGISRLNSERCDVDEPIPLMSAGDGPAASALAFVQETASEFRRSLVGGSLGCCGVRQIDPLLIPAQMILGREVEVAAGHWNPLWLMAVP
jgi:hypothetical protein